MSWTYDGSKAGGLHRAAWRAILLSLMVFAPIGCTDDGGDESKLEAPEGDVSPGGARGTLIITRTQATVGGTVDESIRRVEVTLLADDGGEQGGGSASVRDGRWEALVLDPETDAEAYPMPGQSLEFRWLNADAEVVNQQIIVIPDLHYSFTAKEGSVEGAVEKTPLGWGANGIAFVALSIGNPEIASSEADVSTDGSFNLSVGEATGAGNSSARLSIGSADGSTRMVEVRRVPYVRVSLRPGDITGAMAPLSEVEIKLSDADGTREGRAHAFTGPDGRFEAWIRDDAGERIRPRPGDRIIVNDGFDRRDWTLPAMVGGWDRASGELRGIGTPGNSINILMWNPWHKEEDDEPTALVADDGSWATLPDANVLPATHYYVTERFPLGDELYFCYQIPILHAQPGSAVVTVEALWEVEAEIDLIRGGWVIASAAGGGTWSGEIEMLLVDSDGEAVPAIAGDEIIALLDGERTSLNVADLEAQIGELGQLIGTAPPGTIVGAATSSPIGELMTVGTGGEFALKAHDRTIAGGPNPGDTISAFTLGANGNVTHKRFVGPSLEVRLDELIIIGTIDPQGPPARVLRVNSSGTSTAMVEPSWDVRFELRADTMDAFQLTDDLGTDTQFGSAGMAALQRFELSQARSTTAITVPMFSAVVDGVESVLSGIGPADEIVDIKVWIGESVMPESLSAFIDADGKWRAKFGAHARGRFSYTFDEVSRFEVRLRLGSNTLRIDVPGGRPPEG